MNTKFEDISGQTKINLNIVDVGGSDTTDFIGFLTSSERDWRDPIFGVHVEQAEWLVAKGTCTSTVTGKKRVRKLYHATSGKRQT